VERQSAELHGDEFGKALELALVERDELLRHSRAASLDDLNARVRGSQRR
jgi:hypothetical protein